METDKVKIINVLLSFQEAIEQLKEDESLIGICLYTNDNDNSLIKTIKKIGISLKVFDNLYSDVPMDGMLTIDNILTDKWMLITK